MFRTLLCDVLDNRILTAIDDNVVNRRWIHRTKIISSLSLTFPSSTKIVHFSIVGARIHRSDGHFIGQKSHDCISCFPRFDNINRKLERKPAHLLFRSNETSPNLYDRENLARQVVTTHEWKPKPIWKTPGRVRACGLTTDWKNANETITTDLDRPGPE
jgi:hypothetical protein